MKSTDIDVTQNVTFSIPQTSIVEKFNQIVKNWLEQKSVLDESTLLEAVHEDVGKYFATTYLHTVDEITLGAEFFSRDAEIVAAQLTDTQQLELLNEILYKPESLDERFQALLEECYNKHCPPEEQNLKEIIQNSSLEDVVAELAVAHAVSDILRELTDYV